MNEFTEVQSAHTIQLEETGEARYLKKLLFNWSNRDLDNPYGGIKQHCSFKRVGAALYIKNT